MPKLPSKKVITKSLNTTKTKAAPKTQSGTVGKTAKTTSSTKKSAITEKGLLINGKMTFPVFLKQFQSKYPYLGMEMMYIESGKFLNDTSLVISVNKSEKEICIKDSDTCNTISKQLRSLYRSDIQIYFTNNKGNHFAGRDCPLHDLNSICKELGCKKNP
ncbi:MAG: hypothetical protein IK008_05295 [Bacteroidales bacterium]|nr:hypothetical protein [Bacteroidales bacterium]